MKANEVVRNHTEIEGLVSRETWPGWGEFVEVDDLTVAAEMECELKRLLKFRDAVDHNLAKRSYDEALAAFSKNSDDKIFKALETATTRMALISSEYHRRVSTLAKEVLRGFFNTRFLPWAVEILEKGLARAQSRLAEITASEEKHHLEVTGELLRSQPTPVIEKAQLPITEMKNMLALLRGPLAGNVEFHLLGFLKVLRGKAGKK